MKEAIERLESARKWQISSLRPKEKYQLPRAFLPMASKLIFSYLFSCYISKSYVDHFDN